MIVKMNKYTVMLYHQELTEFLEKVQKLGMVDIIRVFKPLDSRSKEMEELRRRYNSVHKTLEGYLKEPETAATPLPQHEVDDKLLDEKLKEAELSIDRLSLLKAELIQIEREITEFSIWGDFNNEDIEKIKSLGYDLHFYIVADSKFKEEWSGEKVLHIINRNDGKIYFVILSPKGEDYSFPLPESKFPYTPVHTLEERRELANNEIKTLTENLEIISSYRDQFARRAFRIGADLDRYLAAASAPTEVEGKIALITGFAPVENSPQVESFLREMGVYYVTEDASVSDNPPIKLKNNFFSRLFEPIGELYMLPKYGELDLTPFFAPFYMLFFGFCLGDMGYGLTLLLLGGIAKFKLPKMKAYLTLVQFMGIGAIIMAAFSGVFYGTKIYEIFSLSEQIDSFFFSDIKMFWFAIIFGLVHIIFARLISAIYAMKTRGIKYGLSNIGWIIVIIWASFAYAKTMVEGLTTPFWFNYFGMAGAVLILFFSANEGNLIIRIFKGTASFYDITGIFGDMLSYIRLFGLGTSGGILGMVVNSVAMNMIDIPYIGWFFAGLMLIIGHLAVLLLSSLGAFVHPMRLTFVEFYKNAGFTGGGRAFRPLTDIDESAK